MTDTATAIEGAVEQGTWVADTAHSSIEFTARYLMATKVRGRFQEWTATVTTGETPADAQVVATIPAASIDTGNPDRDRHVKSADFFDVERFPALEFRSTAVGPLSADGHFELTGDLTAHGVTNPVTLDVEFAGVHPDPFGNTRATFSATAELDRERWGLTWNAPLANGGYLVSKTIKVEAELQYIRQKDEQPA